MSLTAYVQSSPEHAGRLTAGGVFEIRVVKR